MSVQTIDTPDATITIDTRPSGDGRGSAQTITLTPKPGTPAANADALRTSAMQALATNAAFLALSAPTNAQALAQTQRLTRECSAVIRLLLGQLDDTAGT
jgi:hypothetical protein